MRNDNGNLKPFEGIDLKSFFASEIQKAENEEKIELSVNGSSIKKYNEIFEKIQEKSKEKIEFLQPIITISDVPLLYPNSIAVIQGSKGVHKSRFVETIASALLNKTNENIIGLEVSKQDFFVVYFDSERNLQDQLPFAVQKIKTRAGYQLDEFPDNFYCTSFVNSNRNQRLKDFNSLIEELRSKAGNKHLVIIIDILTDLIGSFNDVIGSLTLTDYLNDIINQFDCSIIGVIHQNPVINSEKARGHLGTEIVNKASSVIQIALDDDFICLKFLALRGSKLPKEKIYLKYDESIGGLIFVDKEEIITHNTGNQEFFEKVYEILKDKPMNRKTLIETLKDVTEFSESTIKRKLQDIENRDFGGRKIVKSKQKNQTLYSINSKVDEQFEF